MKATIVVALASLSAMNPMAFNEDDAITDRNAIITQNALRLSSVSTEKKKPRQKRRRRPLFKTSLKSLARRAVRQGSSTWGDHITSSGRKFDNMARTNKSTSMKKSSSIFISNLHNKIQKQRQQHPKETQILSSNRLSIEDVVEKNGDDYYPEEHFIQEIIAVLATGAAATSAFAAVTTGAFIATLAVAVGSVVTVMFLEDEEVEAAFFETAVGYAADQEEIRGEDCDITGESSNDSQDSGNISQHHEESIFFSNFTLNELRRCYNGRPNIPMQFSLQFSHHIRDGMCIIDAEKHESIKSKEEEEPGCSESDVAVGMVGALEDACSAGECEKIVPSIHPLESTKRVNVVWHDPLIADDSYHKTYIFEPERKKRRKRPQRISERSKEYADSLTDAEKEGAIFLSQSLRVAASAFGVVADAVRFTGETAAVCTGSTARLAGGVFRLSGWAMTSLGTAIENSGAKRDSMAHVEDPLPGKFRTSTRKIAGESVRLLGESIEQVADSLLLAGSATERVAFAAASVAEGAVRFFEDVALSVSDVFARENPKALTSGPRKKGEIVMQEDYLHTDQINTPAMVVNNSAMLDGSSLIESEISEDHHDQSDFFVWALKSVDDIMADTIGVGSLTPELLGVFVACYLGSLVLLCRSHRKGTLLGEREWPSHKPSHISVLKEHHAPHESVTHDMHNDTDSHTTLTADWTKAEKHATTQSPSTCLKHIANSFLFLTLLPMKLFLLTVGRAWNFAFNRKTILLVLYSMGFLFLSRSSQYKAAVIKRKSELLGYHEAISSIGQTSMSYMESSMWLNSLLRNVWRVNNNTTKNSFGGLEPYLSSLASESLVESLGGSYQKPSGVAHVSLNSFTFGKTPPMLRGIEVSHVDDAASITYMKINVGVLMESELLLDISPSSLEYKMVPTTTLSINSLDAEILLDVSVKSRPSYPYISHVNVSLSHEIPDFSLRIEPRSQSGLKGVDFGSFPLISKWIKEIIFESLREYVAPKYISIDIAAWLNGESRFVSYVM